MYNRDKIIATMQEIYDESKSIAPYVVIAQPRRDLNETAAQNFDGYDGLHIDLMGFSHGFCNIGGEKVDVARNYLIEQALESGGKYVCIDYVTNIYHVSCLFTIAIRSEGLAL